MILRQKKYLMKKRNREILVCVGKIRNIGGFFMVEH